VLERVAEHGRREREHRYRQQQGQVAPQQSGIDGANPVEQLMMINPKAR